MALKVFTEWEVFPRPTIPPLVEYSDAMEAVTSLDRADLVLAPHAEVFDEYSTQRIETDLGVPAAEHESLRRAYRHLIERATARNLPVVAVRHSDFESAERIPNSITFQTTLFRSTRGEHDYCLAGFDLPDLAAPYGDSPEWWRRPYAPVPSVGFQGSVRRIDHSLERYARDAATWGQDRVPRALRPRIRRVAWNEGQLLRDACIRALDASDLVVADITRITRGYINASPADQERNRATYLDKLRRNPYALCVRGRGNFSYRLYEALSLYRIPLFVDTDSVLPFDHEVDWRSAFVWVDESDVDLAPQILSDFHRRLDEAGLWQAQARARALWEQYCTPEGFWSKAGALIASILA